MSIESAYDFVTCTKTLGFFFQQHIKFHKNGEVYKRDHEDNKANHIQEQREQFQTKKFKVIMFSEQVTSEKKEFMQNQITSKRKDGAKGKIGKNLLPVISAVASHYYPFSLSLLSLFPIPIIPFPYPYYPLCL